MSKVNPSWKDELLSIFLAPFVTLSLGYILNLNWQLSPFYWNYDALFKIEFSFLFLTSLKFFVGLWVTYNIFKVLHHKFEEINKNEIFVIFIPPALECIEGILSVTKLHLLLPSLNLHMNVLLVLFFEGVAKGLLIFISSRVIYRTFSQIKIYFSLRREICY